MKVLFWSSVLVLLLFEHHLIHTEIIDMESWNFLDDWQEYYTIPCIVKLCNKYFKSERALTGSLVIINLPREVTGFQSKIIKALNEDELHEIGVMVKDARKKHWNASHVTEKAKNYLMLIEDSSELEATVHQLKGLPTWNPLAQVVVLFTAQMDDFVHELEVKNVMIELFEYSMLNVNVMSQRYNTNIIQTQTWFPYEGENCANTILDLRLIDECEYAEDDDEAEDKDEEYDDDEEKKVKSNETSIFVRESHYFSDFGEKSPKNLHGCPLKVSTAIWEPYVVGTDEKIKAGLEVKMIQAITTKLNMVPVYKILPREVPHLKITNNNKTGFYADLLLGKTDIMIGGLYENTISRSLLSVTIPYYQDDLTWCVAVAKLAPTWMNVFVIFTMTTWLAAIVTQNVCGTFLYLVAKAEDVYKQNVLWAMMQSLCLSLGLSNHYNPKKIYTRIFVGSLFVYGIHFNAAYNSFLISVLTRPRYQTQVSTAAMAVEQQFHFAGTENVLTRLKIKNDRVSEYIDTAYEVCRLPDECLASIKYKDKLAVAISREHSRNSKNISNNDLYCFSKTENIYTFSVTMFVKKDYHLLPKINDIIRRISESGLLNVWLEGSQLISKRNLGASRSDPVRLTVKHVQGAFILGGIGVICATLAFIAEWLVYYMAQKRNNKFFEKYFEKPFLYNRLEAKAPKVMQTVGSVKGLVIMTSKKEPEMYKFLD